MSLTLITPPEAEPITLAEAREQCRIDGTADDALLTIAIAAARSRAEHETRRRLITQTWRQTLPAFPAAGADIPLEVAPAASVPQVVYVNAAGATVTLAPGVGYVLDAAQGPAGVLHVPDGTTWPDTASTPNAVRIDIVAGYGSAGSDVPSDIRAWMLLTIGFLYAQREAIDSTGRAAVIPGRWCDALLDAHRVFGL